MRDAGLPAEAPAKGGYDAGMANELWPALPYDEWKDTLNTVHMWTQVVGKIALGHAPPENHSWGVAMHVTPRGLATKTLFHGTTPFSFDFDFLDHQLVMRVCRLRSATLKLAPMTVADFYRAVMRMCEDAGLPVRIWTLPAEIPNPVRFELDTDHHSYDPAAMERFFVALSQVDRVFRAHRSGFIGKSSPVHFFWGSFDLAVTRFSGRPAPPKEGPRFMRDAYSHEVISHGFWAGSEQFADPAFYAYAVPEPDGLKAARIRPDAGYYHAAMGEFILPYDAVRLAEHPEQAILDFMDSTYDRASTLAGWDRASLERTGATA
jgi:hypothetical protein